MKKFQIMIALAISCFALACEKGEEAENSEAPADAPAKTEAADDKAEEEPGGDADSMKGVAKFSIDGEKKSFDYFPPKKTMAMSFGTLMLAKPEKGATEEFSFNATNFNVRKAELPATIKFAGGSGAEAAKAPQAVAQYVSKEGVQYRSHVEITFESFEGGVVKGKITDDELPPIKPKDKDKPPKKLSGMTFEFEL